MDPSPLDPRFDSTTAPPATQRWRAGLLRNLGSGLLLLVLGRVTPERFVRSFEQLLALLALNLLVWAGLDTLQAEAGAQLMLDGLYGLACYLLMGLFGCALIARIQAKEADTRAVLIPVLAVSPYVLVLLWLLGDLPQVSERPIPAMLAVLVYLAILSVRVLRAAFGEVHKRTAIAAILLILLAPAVLQALDLDTRLWIASEDSQEEAQSDDSSEEEPLLYDQPARIAAAVERVTPRKEGTPAAYFVGFAGFGDQGVFKREALFAESVFADHFGSSERSIQLINDVEDRDTYPLASVSGLQQTLKLLAARMDPEQDVLVLTLTSHGSEEGLSVANGDLPLLQLGPADLRQALDESGIKWRVVIVSACYAGVFLDALKNDATMIVTASDAEHSSFGCEDDRDLTYFGEAFLRDSVPSTATLEEAFRKAAGLIEHRETAEHKIHSNPQLYVGPRIREKLAVLEAADRGAGHTPFNVKR